jgi:pimeloyl-ACP methyl ester carboxylesterase
MIDMLLHRWLKVPYALYASARPTKKKHPKATVLFIHGIGNSGKAWSNVIDKLPKDIQIVTVDLLGFGQSPQPEWAIYSAKTQARSVIATLFKLRLTGQVIIVGHSLGALVAVEVAKRYPLLVRSLVLCSPPFYKEDESKRRLTLSSDKMLINLFKLVRKRPDEFVRVATLVTRMGLVNATFSLTPENAPIYMNALEASIINQTSLRDATKLKVPISMICGLLDPVVIIKNLRHLIKNNERAKLTTIVAGHEVRGRLYTDTVAQAIIDATDKR